MYIKLNFTNFLTFGGRAGSVTEHNRKNNNYEMQELRLGK